MGGAARTAIGVELVDAIRQLREVGFGEDEKIVFVGKEHLGALLLFKRIGLMAEPLVPPAVHELHERGPCGGLGVMDCNRLDALIDNEEDRHQHSSVVRLEVGEPGAKFQLT